jgi:hypothetical protein
MTDLSGITITTGILPAATREGLARAVDRIGAKMVDGVRIDTTHFVTTEGRGVQWEKATEMNIPVVRPEWVEACETNGRILGVTKFYLDAVRTAPPAEPPAQKDLPAPPPPRRAGDAAEAETETQDRARPGPNKEETVDDDASEDESGDEPDSKVRGAGQDEQKVRVEDRNQKLALRPGQPGPKQAAAESDNDEEADKAIERGRKSPGDGSSFQDVAL